MKTPAALLAAAVAAAIVAAAAAAPARGAVVSLRVADSSGVVLYDGPVDTGPHPVDGGDGTGPHPCAGPPGAAPSATATGALDDALRVAGISWRGNWDPNFGDFFVDRIGSWASAPPDRYWLLTVNGGFTAGGCQATVSTGDAVAFLYGPLFATAPGAPGHAGGGGESNADGKGGGTGDRDKAPHVRPGRLRRIASRAAGYLRRSRSQLGWVRLALAVRGRGNLARAAARLLAGRLASQRQDGSLGGDANATAVAVLALRRRRPRRAERAASWLAAQQDGDGGIAYRAGAPADVDTTGLAAWALAAAGKLAAARRAAVFVRSAQAADGGFPAIAGAASNAQSTAMGLLALRVAGLGPRSAAPGGRTPLDYLAALARRDGSIAYARRLAPTPAWTTAQALLGLTARSKLLDFDAGPARG